MVACVRIVRTVKVVGAVRIARIARIVRVDSLNRKPQSSGPKFQIPTDGKRKVCARIRSGLPRGCRMCKKWRNRWHPIYLPISSCPKWTPSAPTAMATSTRSLMIRGTPLSFVTPSNCVATRISSPVSLFLSRYCTTVTPIMVRPS